MRNLVFFHGWGANGRVWQRQVENFGSGSQAFTVLTPTIPTWEPEWLAGYLEHLPWRESLLIGWSLGGMLLLETLAKLAGRPGGLVLVGVAPVFCRRPDHPWGQQVASVRAMRRALKDDPHGVLQEFAHRCLAPGEEAFRAAAETLFQAGAYPENLAPGLDYLLQQDLRPYLPGVAGRPIIVQGDQDAIVPVAQSHFLHQQLKGSRLHLLPGAGHLPFLTQAAAFNEMLENILRGGPGEFFVSAPPPSPQTPLPTPNMGAGEVGAFGPHFTSITSPSKGLGVGGLGEDCKWAVGPLTILPPKTSFMEIKQGIRRNFARRAATYDAYAATQRWMAQRLMALTGEVASQVAAILEIGCGTGYLTQQLRQANSAARLVALDLDAALVDAARRRLGPNSKVAWLVADGETWVRSGFDLIIANAVFQWLTRPAPTLAAYFRSLNPGGVLAFSTLGPQTFKELGASLKQAANGLNFKVMPEIPAQGFLDKQSWAGLLSQAGFHKTRLTQELITVTFPTVRDFLKSLQATGATNPQPRAFAPRLFKALMAAYESGFGYNGFIPVTYEIIWAVARK